MVSEGVRTGLTEIGLAVVLLYVVWRLYPEIVENRTNRGDSEVYTAGG
jgi:hypothetical protein